MSTRPLVLHVAPFLWSGAGSVITRLCEHQRRKGRVVLVTTSRSEELRDWGAYRRALRRAGVEHHSLDVFHRDSATMWSSSAALAALVRGLAPRVIHAHSGIATCNALIARDLSGLDARIVGQMYSWGPNRPRWMDRQDFWGFARADCVVCSAHEYQAMLLAGGVKRSRLVYLPWGLPLDELPLRPQASPRRPPGGPRIGFAGRIEPRKGQLELVDALALVRARVPTATLELVGPVADDDYGSAVRGRIAALGLDEAVTLSGMVPDVRRRVAAWDLFVSLSADEGQGLAVLEAMAIGVPVLARPVAGLVDFLRDGGTGLVIGRAGPRAAAARIVDALGDAARLRRVVRSARRLVEQRYDWADTVRAFEAIYAG